MINTNELKQVFDELRLKQADLHRRPLTNFDKHSGDKIFEISMKAINDVSNHNHKAPMQAASLPTGSGKSTSAYALIAANALLDEDFSAAYIVPTVKMGIEAQEGIESLLGKGSTVLWSSYHKDIGRNEDETKHALGFLPDRVHSKSELPESRIIIVTHNLLKYDMKNNHDSGCQCYMNKPRSIVFIDEHPDFVDIITIKPSDIQSFHDDIAGVEYEHAWLPLLAEVTYRMSMMVQSSGKGYTKATLLSTEEAEALTDESLLSILDAGLNGLSFELKAKERLKRRRLLDFLIAASKLSCFYSKVDKSFIAYRLDFEPKAGFILLDATADITGLVDLHPDIKLADQCIQVDYSNLKVIHGRLPKSFQNIRKVKERHELGTRYGRWIKKTVLANTKAGDDVLVVVHKAVLDLNFVIPANAPEQPDNWEGRTINTQNWGAGVGLNKFKNKSHVFLFHEFHPKRSKTISDTHAWGQQDISDELLTKAEGKKKTTGIYSPTGIYLSPYEGHLLRWHKQLAMRGNARNVDDNGKCGAMTLYTTMPMNRLLKHYDRLFPNAALPMKAELPTSSHELTENLTGKEGLKDILMSCMKAEISADEILRLTGIKSNHLARDFNSETVSPIASAYGWRLVSAKDLGKSGRLKYIVNDNLRINELMIA
jgi:hypothetical protein